MKNDPEFHRDCQRRFIEHAMRLLGDERLRVDTTAGHRQVVALMPTAQQSDHGVELKRLMSEMNRPDRSLQERMPMDPAIDVTLFRRSFLLFRKTVGKLRIISVSPTRDLLAGQAPEPMDKSDVERELMRICPAQGVPQTIALLSTSGFTLEAHDLAERRADRVLILVEPNDAGGFNVHGPVETKALVDLFDPEAEEEKRRRINEVVESEQTELAGSGIAADRIAAKTQLPTHVIEAELKSYAKSHAGLVAKRLDGRLVLFREGSAAASAARSPGGPEMPMIDRLKSLFSRKGDHEKKIAFLSERRAALGQQRDRAYEEIASLEQKDSALRRQFREMNAELAKRRVSSQLVQLGKDMQRRQQMLGVLNQQINIVSTHLHNLELVQHGQSAQLPDSEEMASDAAAAEEVLARLEADNELADSIGGISTSAMSEEEQAMYEQLEREAAGPAPQPEPSRPVSSPQIKPPPLAAEKPREARRSSEPEPG